MSLSQEQKDTAKVTLFKQARFSQDDVINTLLRQGVAVDAVKLEAVQLVGEWCGEGSIREIEPKLYQRVR